MNNYIESRNKERYMRFEKVAGATGEFWELYVPDRFNIWLCEGAIGSEGVNSHLSWRDWGSMDEGVNLQWASKLVDAKQNDGFFYSREVKKIIDTRYKNALTSQNPQELLDCLCDGYSPFAVVDSQDHAGSAMENAIAGGVVESVRTLVNAGCHIDRLPEWRGVSFNFSRSPLLFALANSGDTKMIEFILALGADVNKTSGSESMAPLHAALYYGGNSGECCEIVKILIKHKANINNAGYRGDGPIILAASRGAHDAVQLLLDNGADLSVCNDDGENSLILAASAGSNKTIRILLNAGLDANSRNKDGKTALMFAAEGCDIEALNSLITAGADIEAEDKYGKSALMFAASRHNIEAINHLITAGVDIDAIDNDGQTALIAAAADRGSIEVINCLVTAGADIDARDKDGKTALIYVAGGSENTWHFGAGENTSLVKWLIKAGSSLDLQDATGKTAAMFAAWPARGEKWKSTALKSLIKAGANLALEDRSGRGVLQTRSAEAAMVLLDAGVVPNATDGESLLGLAIADDNLTLTLKVLEKGVYNIIPVIANIKKNLPTLLKKIAVTNPLLLNRLTSQNADIQALLDGYLKKSLSAVASEYVRENELPDILKPGVWPGLGKGKAAPNLPGFWNALIHPSPRLLSNPKPLPPDVIDTIGQMILMSNHDAPIPAIAQVQAACDRQSLANFALSIFHEWIDKGSKANDGFFQVLGYWGDGKSAKTLTSLIQHWPRVHLSQRAALGLEILGTMGNDIALMQIQAIAAKTKYDSLRRRAEALMQEVATARNLSAEQLEDRLVPSFELSDDGILKIDFGSRFFLAGVNERLQPILKDANGLAIKALPKVTPSDDVRLAAQSSAKWLEFKKDIKAVAALQLGRFEQAMSNSLRWVGEDFNNLLVNHPMLQKAVRGLVWAVYQKKKLVSTFAFRPDGSAIDVNGIAFVVPPDASVGVPHPLDMGAELDAWKEIFRQSKQAQPFPQLVRKVYLKESDLDNTLFGLQGLVVPSMAFKGLKALGWDLEDNLINVYFDSFSRCFASGSASITVSPGLTLAAYDAFGSEQTLSVDAQGLAPVDFSELVRELQTLKG